MNNNKERLFEIFSKVNKIRIVENESYSDVEEIEGIVNDFVNYIKTLIDFNNVAPNVEIIKDSSYTEKYRSFASYNPSDYQIYVVGNGRCLADVLRSLAHELFHHYQNINNQLHNDSGNTGSIHENEANSFAGIALRNYGKINSKIYELKYDDI